MRLLIILHNHSLINHFCHSNLIAFCMMYQTYRTLRSTTIITNFFYIIEIFARVFFKSGSFWTFPTRNLSRFFFVVNSEQITHKNRAERLIKITKKEILTLISLTGRGSELKDVYRFSSFNF
jgi:hypothetical protein